MIRLLAIATTAAAYLGGLMLGDALGTAANLSIIVGGVIGLVAATWNLVHRIDMVMLKVEGLERSLKNLPCHEGGCACRKEHR